MGSVMKRCSKCIVPKQLDEFQKTQGPMMILRTLSRLDIRLANAEADFASLDKTVKASNEHLTRLKGIVQEMSLHMTRLTWAVNLWGAVITVLLLIILYLSGATIQQ
jgi:hypothetical protein